MSNRMLHQYSYGLEPKPVKLYAVLTVGGSGAVTLTRAKGISSVVHNSTGNYTLTLQDTYQTLLGFRVTTLHASTGVPTAPVVGVVSQAVATAAAPTIIFQTLAAQDSSTTTLTATDPASGEVLYVEITLSDSSAL